jgi:hypothetical protein
VLYTYKLTLTYWPGFKVKDRDLDPNPEFHEKQDPDSDPKKTLLLWQLWQWLNAIGQKNDPFHIFSIT